MVWVLLVATGVLAALVGALAWRVLRLERRLAQQPPDPQVAPAVEPPALAHQYVITRIGEPAPDLEPEPTPVVAAPVFADLVLKETVVQTASLLHGLRRALAPETRNRIRFHVRQEVKRSRKQRRAEQRDFRREWAARQREDTAA